MTTETKFEREIGIYKQQHQMDIGALSDCREQLDLAREERDSAKEKLTELLAAAHAARQPLSFGAHDADALEALDAAIAKAEATR